MSSPEVFETITGVKYDCILNSLFFSLCLNDIADYLDGGKREVFSSVSLGHINITTAWQNIIRTA